MRSNLKRRIRTLLFGGVFFFLFFIFLGNVPCVEGVGVRTKKENPFGWERLASYATYFNEKEGGRAGNIAIAAALIDGVTIQPYGEFSFNATVGRRTAEAGFQDAKIIVNGEYVQGVGGGVCQVSTTLYNAALLSGLTVTEFHPHSLSVAYVSPSRDAMVSSHSDLKLYNPSANAVHLNATALGGEIRVSFYGKRNGFRYAISTAVLGEIPPPSPIVKDGECESVLRAERKGVRSESYLEMYKGAQLLSRKRLRVDEYRPIQGIIVKKVPVATNKIASNACVFTEKML